MYAQVVVLTYQPPDIDSYTYEIPKNLKVKVGQLVSVPFGKRNPLGLILDTKYKIQDTRLSIKPITSIILDQPILLHYQIELLKWLSSYYLAPMSNCLEAMLPEIPKKQLSVNSSQFTAKSVNQTIVLVSSINRLPESLAAFPQAKNPIIYHNELKISEKFSAWQKILSGQCDFIFGSRSAIFAPCPNLKKIIIYDEHDNAYKDERSPYFDTLTVAEKIADLTKAKIEIIDSSPRVTTYANHQNDITFPVITSTAKQSQKQIATSRQNIGTRNGKGVVTKTIDMTNEKVYGNYSPISQTLEEILKRAAAKKLRVLLFLNKKSESGSVYCKSCKTQTVVPKPIDACPSCGSADIYFNSVNITSLTKTLNSQLSTFNSVDIATAAAFYKLTPQKYDIVVHIKTDSILNIPDYASSEKLYAQIINLKKLARRMVILQTYNPDHPAIKTAIDSNYPKFYLEEIKQRKTFSYPPFSLLIKISVSGKNAAEKSAEVAEKLSTLDSRLSTFDSRRPSGRASPLAGLSTSILGPYPSVNRQNIILKLPLPNYSLAQRTKILEKLKAVLPHQKDIKIIVEPDSII